MVAGSFLNQSFFQLTKARDDGARPILSACPAVFQCQAGPNSDFRRWKYSASASPLNRGAGKPPAFEKSPRTPVILPTVEQSHEPKETQAPAEALLHPSDTRSVPDCDFFLLEHPTALPVVLFLPSCCERSMLSSLARRTAFSRLTPTSEVTTAAKVCRIYSNC
jgi:hypothetical protein